MKLKELLEDDPKYSSDQIRFFLAMLKETDCLAFVEDLCQAAYNIGYEDATPE